MSDYDDHARAVPDLVRQTLAAFRRLDSVALWFCTADATVTGAASSPVTGGGRSDPTANRTADPPPDIERAVERLHNRLRDSLSELHDLAGDYGTVNERGEYRTDAATPTGQCDCRGCSRTACAGDRRQWCIRCHRVIDSGRECGPGFHERWRGSDGIRVDQEDLCRCENDGHGHKPGYCARTHDGGSKRLCSDCRTCRCQGDCGRGHDPGGCQGDMDGSRRQCKNCRQARWRNSNGEAA